MNKITSELTHRTSKGYGYLITSVLTFISVFMMWAGCASCNPSKQATKQANKHFVKAMTKSQAATANNCAISFPPITGTKDSFIYIQGEDKITHDTVQGNEYLVVGDTVIKKVYITKTIKQTDTLYRSSDVKQVNNAALFACNDENKKLTIMSAKDKKALSICLWAIVILGAYTLVRWILRIWNIKLP